MLQLSSKFRVGRRSIFIKISKKSVILRVGSAKHGIKEHKYWQQNKK